MKITDKHVQEAKIRFFLVSAANANMKNKKGQRGFYHLRRRRRRRTLVSPLNQQKDSHFFHHLIENPFQSTHFAWITLTFPRI